MKTMIEVFDPAMCCSTGVCGPSVDPALASFAATLGWIGDQGVQVERHNLSQEPGAFVECEAVRELLTEQGDGALPAVLVDGVLRSWGRYPSRDEVAMWALGNDLADATDPAGGDEMVLTVGKPDGGCCGGETSVQFNSATGTVAVSTSAPGCCG